jgi:(R,R)-butanediol dehydrogenase/meso-butanediol dehydrogenase/diacetyl reductase
MKAAVWHNQRDIRVENVPEPMPASGEVKLRIKACGICGSDLHEYRSGPFLIPKKPHPLTGKAGGPLILGHELSGQIVEVGPAVRGWGIGERVSVNPLIYCGSCHYCRKGLHIMCTKLGTYGLAADGGFAEYAVFRESALIKLPDTLTDEMGAFVEPLAVALHAVKRANLKLGDTAAVIGAGPIGLLVLQAALAAGASQVFVVEPVEHRRKVAISTGAQVALDPSIDEPAANIADLTNGLRADIAFDCVGSQASFDTAIKTTGRRARICVVGLAMKPIEVPFIRLWGHEKELTFSSGYENEFDAATHMLSDGRVRVEQLMSAVIGLDRFIEDGIKPLMENPEKYIKVIVTP